MLHKNSKLLDNGEFLRVVIERIGTDRKLEEVVVQE